MISIRTVRSIAIFSLVFCLFAVAGTASAQSIGVTAMDIDLSLSPETPAPNQSVTATLESFTVNLNNQEISWFVNGEFKYRAIGSKSYTFTTGGAGTSSRIEAKIVVSGQVISKIMTINPSTVDILWEADTYVPPFYKGKKLPTRQSTISFVGIPQFKNPTIDSIRGAVYYWERDFNTQPSASGYGKQRYTFENNPLQLTEIVSLSARTTTESETASNSIEVPFREPEFVFYEKLGSKVQWLRGSKGGFQTNGSRFSLFAVPYYAVIDHLGNLKFTWSVDGKTLPASTSAQPNEITFELSEKGRVSRITTTVEHGQKLLQEASGSLQLIY